MVSYPRVDSFDTKEKFTLPAHQSRIARKEGRPQRNQPLMRKYEVAHLTKDNQVNDMRIVAPATPAFEQCFGVVARGGVVETQQGMLAVDDLIPGDLVKTVDNGYQKLLWKGCIDLVPGQPDGDAGLLRVATDTFGNGAPMPDLVLGKYAHTFYTSDAIRRRLSRDGAFVPVSDLIDGLSVISIRPVAAVRLYQLGFAEQERISVNGMQIETLHPGPPHLMRLPREHQVLFESLFPHKENMSEFGAMTFPRLNPGDLELFRAS